MSGFVFETKKNGKFKGDENNLVGKNIFSLHARTRAHTDYLN